MARKHSKKDTGKHLNSQCKQCTREREAKIVGTEERVAVGVYRNPSTAAKVKTERIVLERDSGPRPEARKEEQRKRKVAKMRPESAGAVRQIASRGVGTGVLNAWCLLEESEDEQWEEVTSKKSKPKMKKFAHVSLLSVENKLCASPRNVV